MRRWIEPRPFICYVNYVLLPDCKSNAKVGVKYKSFITLPRESPFVTLRTKNKFGVRIVPPGQSQSWPVCFVLSTTEQHIQISPYINKNHNGVESGTTRHLAHEKCGIY